MRAYSTSTSIKKKKDKIVQLLRLPNVGKKNNNGASKEKEKEKNTCWVVGGWVCNNERKICKWWGGSSILRGIYFEFDSWILTDDPTQQAKICQFSFLVLVANLEFNVCFFTLFSICAILFLQLGIQTLSYTKNGASFLPKIIKKIT